MKKQLALLLVAIQLCAFCACADDGASQVQSSVKNSVDSTSEEEVVVEETDALLYEGKTDYKIVVPAEENNNVTLAVSELNALFLEATGVTFEVISDEGLTYNANDKYISIGNTTLLQGSGIEMDNDELFRSGYIMKTVGNSYFLSGRTEFLSYGNAYAVYDFLGEILNYEYFAPGCYSLDKNVKSIANKDLNVTEIPDIAQRCLGFYSVIADGEYRQRMRLENYNDTDTWVTCGHSQTDIINPNSSLGTTHPEWFSPDMKTICLENMEMRAYLAEYLKGNLASAENAIVVQLGQADNDAVCSCEACEEARETKYMNYSGQQIAFLNDMSNRLRPWIEENYPGREVLFTGFAYTYSEVSPCVYNEETGKYEPFSEYVIPNDDVGIYWAPIRNDFSLMLDDPTSSLNMTSYKAIQGWSELLKGKNIYMWSYCTDFQQYGVNFNNFHTLAGNYRLYADLGVKYIFDQGPTNSGTPTFEELRVYLQSNLMWDTSLDVNELVQRFMKYYYGAGAEQVYEYYKLTNTYYAYLQKHEGFVGTVYYPIADSKYWDIGVLNTMSGILDGALEDIAKSNLRAADKEEYSDRVNRLYMTVKYLYMKNYRGNFTNQQIDETIAFMEKYKAKYDIFNMSEGASLDSEISSWK